jgi:hypothetical protein
VAQVLKDQFQDNIMLETLMMDYEHGMKEAFSNIFEEANLVGCDYHFKEMLKRHIAKEKLQVLYDNDTDFELLVHYIWALIYIRSSDVVYAWETVIKNRITAHIDSWKENHEKGLRSFLKYVDRYCVGEMNLRTKQRRAPLYSPVLWNKFEAILSGEARTNNAMEGYNRTFSLSLPTKASVWVLCERFIKEEALAKKSFMEAAMGGGSPEANKSRSKERDQKEEQLRALVSNYGNMPLGLYMEGIVGFFTM